MNYDTNYLSPLMETNNNINIHKNGESVNLIIELWLKYLLPFMETNNNINIHNNGESVNLIIELWYTDFLPKPESKIYVILTSRIKAKGKL